MRMKYIGACVLGAAAGATAFYLLKGRKAPANPPKVVNWVDLNRYLGDWYDIAHYPAYFEQNRVSAMAHYSLNENGTIKVINTCREDNFDGKLVTVTGKAWVVDKTTNAKLKVQFFWPFAGDYWILDLDEAYQWALVGSPDRKYLWILSRSSSLPAEVRAYILGRIVFHGYDPGELIWEPHRPDEYTETK